MVKKLFSDIWNRRDGDKDFRKNLIFLFSSYFFVLASYPAARSATSGIFYEFYTAQDYPFATFLMIVALTVVLGITNWAQKYLGVHKLYLVMGSLTSIIFLLSLWGSSIGIKYFALALFCTKEIYIVVLLHMALAFSNGYLKLDEIKAFYGPLGAVGSIGAILGGQLTSLLAKNLGTDSVILFSILSITITMFLFYKTRHVHLIKSVDNKYEMTPLEAISKVKKYVCLVASIIALSQFVIYIADLQFNIVFEQTIEQKDQRTAFLGQLYSLVNGGSLLLQFLVIPFLMLRVATKNILYFIPLFFLLLVLIGPVSGIGGLYALGGVFVAMKATDYSIFNVVREILYHPLSALQKYGAKYITDIYVYRVAKGGFAFVLSLWGSKSLLNLNLLQSFFLIAWCLIVFLIVKEQKRLDYKID